jgi:hypothetical protein
MMGTHVLFSLHGDQDNSPRWPQTGGAFLFAEKAEGGRGRVAGLAAGAKMRAREIPRENRLMKEYA